MSLRTYYGVTYSSSHLKRSANILDYSKPYTFCTWLYVFSYVAAYHHIFDLGRVTGAGDEFNRDSCNINSQYIRIVRQRNAVGGGTTASTTLITAGVWWFLGLRYTTSGISAHLNGRQAAEVSISYSSTGGATQNHMNIGGYIGAPDGLGSEAGNFLYYNTKIWAGRTLTPGQLKLEMNSFEPVMRENLHAWYPFDQPDYTKDQSGHGYHLDKVNTPTFYSNKNYPRKINYPMDAPTSSLRPPKRIPGHMVGGM